MTTGEQLKLDGMQTAADAVPNWYELAYAALCDLARSGREFTSEDVTARVGLPRGEVETNRNNAVGALMSACARQGIIRRVGYRKAERSDLHAAVVGVWVGLR